MKYLMYSCQQASFLVTKKEEQKLTYSERLRLAMHLAMCKFCKAYEKQSAYIIKQLKHIISSTELTDEDKVRILKSLEK